MRDAARVLLLVLAGLAAVAGLACFALVVGEADRDTQDGGFIVGGALLVLMAALLGVRQFVRPSAPDPRAEGPAPAGDAEVPALPVVLRPSGARFALACGTCVVLTAVCALFALADPWWLLGVGFFGASAVTTGVALVPGRVFVRVDDEGLLLRGALRTRRWRWADVDGFRVVEHHHRYGTTRQVGFDERDGDDRTLPRHVGPHPEALAPMLQRLRDERVRGGTRRSPTAA